MNPLEQVKLLTNQTNEALISLTLDKARQEIEGYLKREYVPAFDNVLVDIAIVKLNRIGTEGLVSQGYSGVSESYADQYPAYILRQLEGFRKKVHFL